MKIMIKAWLLAQRKQKTRMTISTSKSQKIIAKMRGNRLT